MGYIIRLCTLCQLLILNLTMQRCFTPLVVQLLIDDLIVICITFKLLRLLFEICCALLVLLGNNVKLFHE